MPGTVASPGYVMSQSRRTEAMTCSFLAEPFPTTRFFHAELLTRRQGKPCRWVTIWYAELMYAWTTVVLTPPRPTIGDSMKTTGT